MAPLALFLMMTGHKPVPAPREGTSQFFQALQFKAIFPLLSLQKHRAESQTLVLSSMLSQSQLEKVFSVNSPSPSVLLAFIAMPFFQSYVAKLTLYPKG